MTTPLILLCPGQGAQAVLMGKAWFDRSAEARKVFGEADEVLGASLPGKRKLSDLCFNGPAELLNRTDVSQPAIYTTSVACYRALLAQWAQGESDLPLAAVAGLSLGEYTALHIAGAFSFRAGLELVTLRGRAMQDAAQASPSGMLALIGADEPQAQAVCDAARGQDVLVCANFNAPGQIVLSGSKPAIERAAAAAAEKGLRAAPLAVAGAFHSPLMAPAADRLAQALAKTDIREPRCPVISNVTAAPHAAAPGRTMADTIRQRLVEQLTHPVRWEQGCRHLISAAGGGETQVHELAPGVTLAGLMRRIDKPTKVITHDQPE